MGKKIIIIVAALIIIIAVTMTYALLPGAKYPIGDAIANLRVTLFNTAGGVTDAFKSLPNWPVIATVLGLVVGYLMGHYMQVSWQRLKFWGHDETLRPLFPQGGPVAYQQPQLVTQPPAQPPVRAVVPPPDDQP